MYVNEQYSECRKTNDGYNYDESKHKFRANDKWVKLYLLILIMSCQRLVEMIRGREKTLCIFNNQHLRNSIWDGMFLSVYKD